MRIVGGRWAGRDLLSPGGRVRPTAEPLRAAWLDALAREIRGARVLDLYAGTGALGLEALSRGAASVDFVENGPGALHSLKANIAALRVRGRTRLFVRDALHHIRSLRDGAYDIALADPPYGSRQADRVVERWLDVPFSRTLVVEHAAARSLPGDGRTQCHGDSALTFYRRPGRVA